MFGKLVKWLFILLVLAFLVVLGYAFLGDFRAPEEEVRQPVVIDVD